MDESGEPCAVRDDPAASRFELRTAAGTATCAYERRGDRLVLTHTEVPEALRGRGVGGRLVRGALAAARARGLRVVPVCRFVRAYLRRHPEERDVVEEGERATLDGAG